MFSVPRACSRCLGQILRMAAKGQRRFQRTGTDWDWQMHRFCWTHEADRLSTAAATPPEASLSPALLARAQSVATEHAKLAAQTAESYDVAMAKRMGELGPVTTALADWQEAQHVCCYPHSSKMQRCTASLTPCFNDTVARRTPSAPLRPEQRRRAPLPRLGRHQRYHRHAHPAHYDAETHPDPAPPLRPPRLPRRAAPGRRRL